MHIALLHLPAALLASLPLTTAHPRRTTLSAKSPTRTMIPSTCFDSQADFDTDFSYLYPWGATHNGAARMDAAHVSLTDKQLTLTAEYVDGLADATFAGKPLAIKYLSGTVHAKERFTGWPLEVDMAEWKGSGDMSFNTFNASSIVSAHDVYYSDPDAWHSIKTDIRDEDGSDVSIKFYLDGVLLATQYGPDYVDKAMWFVIDLQMEGSSGSPGPRGDTTYQIKELEVLSYNPQMFATPLER